MVLLVAIPARFVGVISDAQMSWTGNVVASFIHHLSLSPNNNKCTEKAAFLINIMILSMLFFFYDGSKYALESADQGSM